jgi:mRNA interferase MazF
MKRGELYVATPPGDYGKPRPVVIVQSDLFLEARDSVTVCLLSSELIAAPLFRVRIKRGPHNRLKRASDVVADKLMTLRKERLGEPLGALTADELAALDQALRRWLAL